jgi:organic radical activating enzyme
MSNKFCKHLSNGYRITINNQGTTYAPCCYWQGPAFTLDKPLEEIAKDRDKINIEIPWTHSACNLCRSEERYKDRNYRIAGNLLIADDLPPSKVGWLDIQADMTCNAGCLICGPWNSSYWEGQLRTHNKNFFMSKKPDLKKSIDTIFEKLDVSDLQHVQFLGGEPFLSNIDQLAFPYITNPEKCLLSYATNGSIDPDQNRMSHWTKFKSVMINYSIDGIGHRFEYLRYPLKWSTVEQNIKKMINANYDNIVFHINHTVTPLNILYYDEFLDWVDNTFPKNKFKGIHTHTAYGTMSVSNASEKLKDKVIAKYGQTHMLSKMVSQIPLTDNKHFLNYIDTWDTRRKQNWRDTFSDVANCL